MKIAIGFKKIPNVSQGFIAWVYNDIGNSLLVLEGRYGSGKACKIAAKKLRMLADRFDQLAKLKPRQRLDLTMQHSINNGSTTDTLQEEVDI